MDSTASTRVWRITKECGRPFPKVCDDDVIDYMVMEAVTLKVKREDQEAAKQRERDEWKRADKSHLKGLAE